MGRPSKPWFRQQTSWWMCMLQGRKRKLVEGKDNKALAEKRFHQLMALKDVGQVDDRQVKRFCKAFLKWSKRHHACDTYRNHKFYIESFAKKYARLPVLRLQPLHVTRWGDSKDWNQTTQYNARRFVFRVFSWAVPASSFIVGTARVYFVCPAYPGQSAQSARTVPGRRRPAPTTCESCRCQTRGKQRCFCGLTTSAKLKR